MKSVNGLGKYVLAITSANEENKVYQERFDFYDVISLTRCILTYKPKNGYMPVNYNVDVVDTLV